MRGKGSLGKKTSAFTVVTFLVVFAMVFSAVPSATLADVISKTGSNASVSQSVGQTVLETLSTYERSNPGDTVAIKGGIALPKSVYDDAVSNEGLVRLIVSVNQELNQNDPSFKSEAESAYSLAFARIKLVAPDAVKKSDLYYALDGFAVEVPMNELKNVLEQEGKGIIGSISIANRYELNDQVSLAPDGALTPDMVNSASLIGAPTAWNLGYTGSGTYVAVIDTGIDYTHENFGGYSTFPNAKIPYGFDFADGDNDPMDHNGHGTHVSGTIAGIGAAKFPDQYGNSVPLKGIAPDAKIIICKVFSDYGQYAYTDDIVSAIDYLIGLKKQGVNIVAANMSLGSAKGFDDPNDPEQMAVQRGVEAGITFSISAGNADYYDATAQFKNDNGQYTGYIKDPAMVGSPGTSRFAITVAAANNQGTVLQGQKLIFDSQSVLYLTSSESPDPVKVFQKKPVNLVDTGTQLCTSDGKNYSGKVVLIDRGTCTFEVKVNNAKAEGAIGVVIGNNDADRSLVSMALGSAGNTIPAVFVGGSDKLILRKAIASSGGVLQVTFSDEEAIGYAPQDPNALASFSSWGPDPNLAFKPTVAAPGVAIFSSVPGGKYETMQGTSMAAPHVSGAIALIKQAHPDWTPDQVKQALVNTADPIGKYSPRLQGAGRINVAKAIKTNLSVQFNGQPYAELGVFTGTKALSLNVSNNGTMTITATLNGYVTTSLRQYATSNLGSIYTVGSLSMPTSITLPASTSTIVQVTITPSSNWTNIFVEGRVIFNASDGNSYVMPYMGYMGDWNLYSDPDTINGDARFPDNNNIVDLPWWNENSWDGMTGLYSKTATDYQLIGQKGVDTKGNPIADTNALAISAGSQYSLENDKAYVGLLLLRNAWTLKISVFDDQGNLIKNIASEEKVRGSQDKNNTAPDVIRGYNVDWVWDGTDINGKLVPEGQYTIKIMALPQPIIGQEDVALPAQIMDIPVKVDRTPPTAKVTWNNYDTDKNVISLTANGYDDFSDLTKYRVDAVVNGTTTTLLTTYAGNDQDNTAQLSVDLTNLALKTGDPFTLKVYAIDGAGNGALAAAYDLNYGKQPSLSVTLVQPELMGEFLVLSTKQASDLKLRVANPGMEPITGTAALVSVQDGKVSTVKSVSFTQSGDVTLSNFLSTDIAEGRYNLTVTVKGDKSSASYSARTIIDNTAPTVSSIIMTTQDNDGNAYKATATINNYTALIQLSQYDQGTMQVKASDNLNWFSLSMGHGYITGAGDAGLGGQLTANIPMPSLPPGTSTLMLVLTDDAKNTATYNIVVSIAMRNTITLNPGVNVFGIPYNDPRTLKDIFGVDVYRFGSNGWVLANEEKPYAFAIYKADVSSKTTVQLQGSPFTNVTANIKANQLTTLSVPAAVDLSSLAQGTQIKVYQYVGETLQPVSTTMLQPFKAYAVEVGKDITITIH